MCGRRGAISRTEPWVFLTMTSLPQITSSRAQRPTARNVTVKRAVWAARMPRPRAVKRERRRRGRAGRIGLGAGGSLAGHSMSTSGACAL